MDTGQVRYGPGGGLLQLVQARHGRDGRILHYGQVIHGRDGTGFVCEVTSGLDLFGQK